MICPATFVQQTGCSSKLMSVALNGVELPVSYLVDVNRKDTFYIYIKAD